MDESGRRPLTSLHEMIRYVRFMYIWDLAYAWRLPTSYALHPLLFFRTAPLPEGQV